MLDYCSLLAETALLLTSSPGHLHRVLESRLTSL